jgi:hypothetical protein
MQKKPLQMKRDALLDLLWLSVDPSERLAPLLNPLQNQSFTVNFGECSH